MSEKNPPNNSFKLIATQATEVALKYNKVELPIPGATYDLNFKHRIFTVEQPAAPDDNKKFVVEFLLNITDVRKIFGLKVKFLVWFQCEYELSSEFIESSMIQINAPAIAFPFARSFVNTITSNAGFPPIFLPSINFITLKK